MTRTIPAIAMLLSGCGLLLDPTPDAGPPTDARPDASVARPDGAPPYDAGPPGTWAWRRPIRVAHEQVDAELAGFPVLVSLQSDAHLAENARDDGADLRFVQDGVALPYEVERFDGANGELVAWVRVPLVSAEVDTTFELRYGNPRAMDASAPASVWAPDHVAVWHLGALPATESANGLDALPSGAPTIQPGRVGAGVDLDGVDDGLRAGNPTALRLTGAITVEAWFLARGAGNDDLVSKMGGAGDRAWDLSFDVEGAGEMYVMFRLSPDGTATVATGYERVTFGAWHHVVGVFEPGVGRRLYFDGALRQEAADPILTRMADSSRGVTLGHKPGDVGHLDARIDEIRVSRVPRSGAWVRASYRNQSEPARFAIVEAPEAIP